MAKLLELSQVAFAGMNDALDPQTGGPRKAKLLQNVYPVDEAFGGGATGRPGITITQNAQLGVAGHRIFQRFYQFTTLTGTEYTVAFCGGLMYTFNWVTRVWTNVPLVGVGLSQDVRVFCVTYNNTLVVNPNDGTNLPWTWDGTNFVSLTNAPLAYGQPTVYYGKLFLIKWTTRNTIDWSEENSANTGYEAGGFLNTWQLTQTDPNIIYAIYGTNEALYYWRARSMGRILGAVTPTFSSDGVHDAISLRTGTVSPAAITNYGDEIFFLDADGRPWVLEPGGSTIPIWQSLRNTLLNVPRSNLTDALACSYTPVPLVLLAVTELNQAIPNLVLTIAPGGNDPPVAGLWRGWTVMAMDMVKNNLGTPTMLIGGNDGYAYEVGAPDGTIWDDGFVSGTLGVQHIVQGSYLGYDTKHAKQFDRLRALLRALTPMTGIVLDYASPELTETVSAVNASAGTITLWGQGVWNSSVWSGTSAESVVEWGIQGTGRWLLPRITHQTIGERFGFDGWECDAFVIGPEPVTV